MTTGKQLAALLLLTTALSFPGTAFAQGTDEDAVDSAADSAPAEEEQYDETDVSIPGGIVVTGRRIQDIERVSTQVVSVLSTEEIARTGEGDIAGALGRVTGLSVQGNGFVYVRGLGDRYSLALLNGLPLPSPQPLSRVVPLDIFPTNIIASSLVQKSYSANFPGEFGGGVINLTTRAVPDESFIKLSVGTSGDTQTTFQSGYSYRAGDLDWLGFDDGTRSVPDGLQDYFDSGRRMSDLSTAEQGAIAKGLVNPNLVLSQKIGKLPANWSAGITAGTAADVGSDGVLGIIATASVSNKWRNRSIVKQTAVNSELDLDTDFRDFVSNNRVLVNALLGFGLEIGDHKIRWTNLFIHDTVKQTSLSLGEDFQDDDTEFGQTTAWYERQLLNSQIVAELEFGDLGVDLRGGYAQTRRDAPFEWDFTYVRTNNANDPTGAHFINRLDRQRGNARLVFSNLTEDLYFGGIDISYPMADWMTTTIGYSYTDTSRVSERREFLFNAPTSLPSGVDFLRPDYLLGDAVIEQFGIGLIETTQSDPAFSAGLEIHGGYGMVRLEPTYGLTVDLGVRYEEAKQNVTPLQVFNVANNSSSISALNNDYWLPSGTITYEVADGTQVRLSASKTIARPQFRELIFQTYYDPETNRQFNGNPFLTDSELINAEARVEHYFGQGNRLTLAGFYKKIDKPIEAYSSFSDNEQVTSFANAPTATLYGGELEFQYNYGLYDWGGWFDSKKLVVVTNYTYTNSEIKVGADDTTFVYPSGETAATNLFIDGVPLTGQSDHLVNLQLGIEDEDILEQLTLLVTYSSDRVTSRGTSGLPDIIEAPGIQVDLVARREIPLFGQPFEFKLEARNIFGENHEEFQDNGTNRIEINTYDVGRTFAISVSTEF